MSNRVSLNIASPTGPVPDAGDELDRLPEHAMIGRVELCRIAPKDFKIAAMRQWAVFDMGPPPHRLNGHRTAYVVWQARLFRQFRRAGANLRTATAKTAAAAQQRQAAALRAAEVPAPAPSPKVGQEMIVRTSVADVMRRDAAGKNPGQGYGYGVGATVMCQECSRAARQASGCRDPLKHNAQEGAQ